MDQRFGCRDLGFVGERVSQEVLKKELKFFIFEEVEVGIQGEEVFFDCLCFLESRQDHQDYPWIYFTLLFLYFLHFPKQVLQVRLLGQFNVVFQDVFLGFGLDDLLSVDSIRQLHHQVVDFLGAEGEPDPVEGERCPGD